MKPILATNPPPPKDPPKAPPTVDPPRRDPKPRIEPIHPPRKRSLQVGNPRDRFVSVRSVLGQVT